MLMGLIMAPIRPVFVDSLIPSQKRAAFSADTWKGIKTLVHLPETHHLKRLIYEIQMSSYLKKLFQFSTTS